MPDIGEVSKRLAERAEAVAEYLLPTGKRVGSEWKTGSVDGDAGRSLGIHLSGDKAGVWKDFASSEAGDLLDLWSVVRGVSLSQAYAEAKGYLGITETTFRSSVKKVYQKPKAARGTKRIDGGGEVVDYLTQERRLSAETVAAYRLAELFDNRLGWQIVFPYKRGEDTINIKYLSLRRDDRGKKITRFETGCELCLFGWQAIPENARSIIICEGELDALSWFQYGYPALSVPNGAQSDKWIELEYENLERFDTIYLSYDEDKEGQSGREKVAERLGLHRVRVIRLPHKDANECLQKGVGKDEISHLFLSAESLDPVELKNVVTFMDEVMAEFYPQEGIKTGFSIPFPKIAKDVIFRPGEVSIYTGINGHGKSLLLSQIILAGADAGEKFCVAPTEMKPAKWLKRQVRQATGERLPIPDKIRDFHIWAYDWMWIFNVTGVNKKERVLEVFEYAWRRYGATQFVIDSLMKLGMAEDDYNGQKAFMETICDFSIKTDSHVHIVAHARKGKDEKEIKGKMDIKGTGAITDLASNVFSHWRNKHKEEVIEESFKDCRNPPIETLLLPDAIFRCDKQREGEWEKSLNLWYDHDSMNYRDDYDVQVEPRLVSVSQEVRDEFENLSVDDWVIQ